MTKQNTNKQEQPQEKQGRKLFSIMSIPYFILIVNGLDIVNNLFTNSDYTMRIIDGFMLAMGIVSFALVVINTILYFKEKKQNQ